MTAANDAETEAREQFRLGIVALAAHDWPSAKRYARKGIMVVPSARTSLLAAKLYALLYAATERSGADVAMVRTEIAQCLEGNLALGAVVMAEYGPRPRPLAP